MSATEQDATQGASKKSGVKKGGSKKGAAKKRTAKKGAAKRSSKKSRGQQRGGARQRVASHEYLITSRVITSGAQADPDALAAFIERAVRMAFDLTESTSTINNTEALPLAGR